MNSARRTYVVRGLRLEADAVLAVELVPADGGEAPAWEPGAHIDLVVGDGTSRQYSLSGKPGAPVLRIAVLREVVSRGGSRWVHEVLRPGQQVEVGGPRNHFAMEPSAAYVFVAGGVGITPMLPMLAAASEAQADWVLHYYGRSLATMAFIPELEAYADRVHLYPADEGGRPKAEELLDALEDGTLVYACGPQRMLDALGRATADRGWEDRLRAELFAAPQDDDAPAPGSFVVHLATTGADLHVPAERSLLGVLVESGVDIISDCEEGICGSCETRVIDGAIDHRDHVLTAQERRAGDCMMVCVSRADGRLTLDL